MDEAINGKDVMILFLDPESGDMLPFMCAENIKINVFASKINTKTRGDGRWDYYIQDTKGFKVSCDGVIPLPPHDQGGVTVWTVFKYLDQMTDLPFQMLFRDTASNLVKAALGNLLVDDVQISAPMDFVGQSMEFTGNGPLSVQDNLLACQATIGNAVISFQSELAVHIQVTGLTNSTRVDFTIDGGGRYAATLNPGDELINLIPLQHPEAFVNGDHTITLIPVCESGDDGAPFILNFTKT